MGGVTLDPARNDAAIALDLRIESDGSQVAVLVVAVDEEALLVRDALTVLSASAYANAPGR